MLRRCSIAALSCLTLATVACNDVVDEEVPIDVCISGKRWIGGDRGSPNMYPGRDCVGCHKDNGAPELILGGTFYDVIDNLGAQGKDCFGAPGVKIRVTSGEGLVYETVTNEAGNFWIAARDTDFVMPITRVETEYENTRTGETDTPGMAGNTLPLYGGCARCHQAGLEPSGEPTSPEWVLPIGPMGARGTGSVESYIEWIEGGRIPEVD